MSIDERIDEIKVLLRLLVGDRKYSAEEREDALHLIENEIQDLYGDLLNEK